MRVAAITPPEEKKMSTGPAPMSADEIKIAIAEVGP